MSERSLWLADKEPAERPVFAAQSCEVGLGESIRVRLCLDTGVNIAGHVEFLKLSVPLLQGQLSIVERLVRIDPPSISSSSSSSLTSASKKSAGPAMLSQRPIKTLQILDGSPEVGQHVPFELPTSVLPSLSPVALSKQYAICYALQIALYDRQNHQFYKQVPLHVAE